jgi:hypothetical protein
MARPDSAMVGAAKYERVENDFYPTEEACTETLYEFLIENRFIEAAAPVYEPACGDGAISKVFEKHGHVVHSSDLFPQYDGATVKNFLTDDFMIDRETFITPLVVTNPPYAMPWINQFMERMNDIAHNDGALCAMLMRNEVDCASTRRKYFEKSPFYLGKLVLTWRPRWIPGSTGSPRHNYAWYIWGSHVPEHRSFISYGFKAK